MLFTGQRDRPTRVPQEVTDCPHLDLHQVDGFHEAWLSGQHGGVEDAASRGDDLATATVDGVCVKGDVLDVETNGPHVLLTQGSLVQDKVFI